MKWSYILVSGRNVLKLNIVLDNEPEFGAVNDNRKPAVIRPPTYMGKPLLEVS